MLVATQTESPLMTPIDSLKKLAEAAQAAADRYNEQRIINPALYELYCRASDEFSLAASPSVVLGLIDRCEKLESALQMFIDCDSFIPSIGYQSADAVDQDNERRETVYKTARAALTKEN